MRTFSLLVASLGALALSALSQKLDSYSDCGKGSIEVNSVSLLPGLEPDQGPVVRVNFEVKQAIEEGAYVDVFMNGWIKLLGKSLDICKEARSKNAAFQCPIQPGAYQIDRTVTLPKEIPNAKFAVNVQGYTAKDEVLLCLDLDVNFMK